jgi:hypothetical protein
VRWTDFPTEDPGQVAEILAWTSESCFVLVKSKKLLLEIPATDITEAIRTKLFVPTFPAGVREEVQRRL